jgi:hypothetical protein
MIDSIPPALPAKKDKRKVKRRHIQIQARPYTIRSTSCQTVDWQASVDIINGVDQQHVLLLERDQLREELEAARKIIADLERMVDGQTLQRMEQLMAQHAAMQTELEQLRAQLRQ